MVPCVSFEDDHLLVAIKPAGLNTHAPSPFAGEGLYDWLRHREPRWADLAIIHRLDKDTSGLIVFSKSAVANRALTAQFTSRTVRKKYLLLTDRRPPGREFTAKSNLKRAGEKYISGGPRGGGEPAETRFRVLADGAPPGRYLLQAEPFTGRTHQIRVHAADHGIPILGDALYGGTPYSRVCLHAEEISFRHPASGRPQTFSAPADFAAHSRMALRTALLDPRETTAFRLIHGASDGWPGWYVDRLGDWLLSQSEQALGARQVAELGQLCGTWGCRGVYDKRLRRQVRRSTVAETSPQLLLGEAAPERFHILENGLQFELSFAEGYSVGLFLDQRDNRRRLLTGNIAAHFPLFAGPAAGSEVLNTFAYTCGFSVCAAGVGARTTSLDLSKKYLEWGKRNFTRNGWDPARHDFIFGDVFDWLKRLGKKGRRFAGILLDPPTFSQSREHGMFRAEQDYGGLVAAALALLEPGGVLFASTNAAGWLPEPFLGAIRRAVQQAGRTVVREHYTPQPPDFPITRAEPGYLKTVWLQVS